MQMDQNAGGIASRGDRTIIRKHYFEEAAGAGIRLGGAEDDEGRQYGVDNENEGVVSKHHGGLRALRGQGRGIAPGTNLRQRHRVTRNGRRHRCVDAHILRRGLAETARARGASYHAPLTIWRCAADMERYQPGRFNNTPQHLEYVRFSGSYVTSGMPISRRSKILLLEASVRGRSI